MKVESPSNKKKKSFHNLLEKLNEKILCVQFNLY